MSKDLDVVALGELLIDFGPAGNSAHGNALFERNAGGAPANVLASLAKLGNKTAFIGKVGDDIFGRFLKGVLGKAGIESRGLVIGKGAPTTLAFVQLDSSGDRSFSFYRNPGADTQLRKRELDLELIDRARIFHFGSLSLTDEPARSATLTAIKRARKGGACLSYDPNLRPLLWRSLDEARTRILSVMNYVDILKVSEEEMEFLTGEKEFERGSAALADRYTIGLVLVTRGPQGCYYRLGAATGSVPALSGIKVVDTTGAGDAFLGGFLHAMLARGIDDPRRIDPATLPEICRFANAVAGLSTTRPGGIPSMPSLADLQAILG